MDDKTKVQDALQKVLEILNSEELKKFQGCLVRGVVDSYSSLQSTVIDAAVVPTVSAMLENYRGEDFAEVLEVAEVALRTMNCKYLAQSLAGIKGSLHPVVPYEQVLYDGLQNQTVITVIGQVKGNANRFQINLYKGSDLAFHFNPRFKEDGKQVLVRNSLISNAWGSEEKDLSSPFPFTLGKDFEVKIHCTNSEFLVEVDKKTLLSYKHRIGDIRQIRRLNVTHDVYIKQVTVDPMPLWMTANSEYLLNDVISEYMSIFISGHVKPNAEVFAINLMQDNDQSISLHLKPMFKESVIVRNSFKGDWKSEEKETPIFPFTRGKSFLMKILCTKTEYKVYINGSKDSILNFKYRDVNYSTVNKVGIAFDVIAWDVWMEPCRM